MSKMLIVNKIEELRKQRNISVVELAKKIGITNQGLYKALKTNDFKVSQLEKIADALEVQVIDFFSGKLSFESELIHFFCEDYNSLLQFFTLQYVDYIKQSLPIKEFRISKTPKTCRDENYQNYQNGSRYSGFMVPIFDHNNLELNSLWHHLNHYYNILNNHSSNLSNEFSLILISENQQFIKNCKGLEVTKWMFKNKILSEEKFIEVLSKVLISLRTDKTNGVYQNKD